MTLKRNLGYFRLRQMLTSHMELVREEKEDSKKCLKPSAN